MNFKQVSRNGWVKGDYRSIAEIIHFCDELFKDLGIVFEYYYEEGLGDAKGAFLLTPSGKQFIVRELIGGRYPLTSFFVLNDPTSKFRDLDEILSTLNLTESDLLYIQKD